MNRAHLPLRHLSAHSRGDQGRGGEALMSRTIHECAVRPIPSAAASSSCSAWADSSIAGRSDGHPPPGWRRAIARRSRPSRGRRTRTSSVRDDGVVTIICHRSEMGQGIRTTMPMIIADEMEADWAQVPRRAGRRRREEVRHAEHRWLDEHSRFPEQVSRGGRHRARADRGRGREGVGRERERGARAPARGRAHDRPVAR